MITAPPADRIATEYHAMPRYQVMNTAIGTTLSRAATNHRYVKARSGRLTSAAHAAGASSGGRSPRSQASAGRSSRKMALVASTISSIVSASAAATIVQNSAELMSW